MVAHAYNDAIQELNQEDHHEFGARVRPCLKTEPKELITANSSHLIQHKAASFSYTQNKGKGQGQPRPLLLLSFVVEIAVFKDLQEFFNFIPKII